MTMISQPKSRQPLLLPLALAITLSSTAFAGSFDQRDLLLQAAEGNHIISGTELDQATSLIIQSDDDLTALLAVDVAASPRQSEHVRTYLIIAVLKAGRAEPFAAAIATANKWAFNSNPDNPTSPSLLNPIVLWIAQNPTQVPEASALDAATLVSSYFREQSEVIPDFSAYFMSAILTLPLEADVRSDIATQYVIKYSNTRTLEGFHDIAMILNEESIQRLRTHIGQASLKPTEFPYGPVRVLANLGDREILPELNRRRSHATRLATSRIYQSIIGDIDMAIMRIELQKDPEDLLKFALDEANLMHRCAWAFQRYLELGGDKQRAKEAFVKLVEKAKAKVSNGSSPEYLSIAVGPSRKVLIAYGIITDDEFPKASYENYFKVHYD